MKYEILIKVLADLIVSIDLSDDELVDPEFATAVLGDAVSVLGDLTPEERMQISEIIAEYAETESDERRRAALRDLPDDLGLLEEDQ